MGKGWKAYERKIANMLGEWCGMELNRTPQSGAWPGTSGDILPKARGAIFPFVIECKNVESWTWSQILDSKGSYYAWVEQVMLEKHKDEEINGVKVFPLIIFTKNYKPDYISFPWIEGLVFNYGIQRYFVTDVGGEFFYILQLEHFLESITYEEFVELIDAI